MTKKLVSANLRNFGKIFKTRGKAVSDGSNQSQNVTGYEIVSFDKIRSRDSALEHFEHFSWNFIFSGEIGGF